MARTKATDSNSTATIGFEATVLRSSASFKSKATLRSLKGDRWLTADTARRDSALSPRAAAPQSLSAAKDNQRRGELIDVIAA